MDEAQLVDLLLQLGDRLLEIEEGLLHARGGKPPADVTGGIIIAHPAPGGRHGAGDAWAAAVAVES